MDCRTNKQKKCGGICGTNKRTFLSDNRGFTLVEIIIVLALVAALSVVGVVGVSGYIKSSRVTKVNRTAETAYSYVQTYLSSLRKVGGLATFNNAVNSWSGTVILYDNDNRDLMHSILSANGYSDDLGRYDADHTGSVICSVAFPGNDTTSPFYDMICDSFGGDADILSGSFLIEYNQTTGIVQSVFYALDDSVIFSYDAGADYSIISREVNSFDEYVAGYHGIYWTDAYAVPSGAFSIMPEDVLTVNGSVLSDGTYSYDGERLFFTFSVLFSDEWLDNYESTMKESLSFNLQLRNAVSDEIVVEKDFKLGDFVDMATASSEGVSCWSQVLNNADDGLSPNINCKGGFALEDAAVLSEGVKAYRFFYIWDDIHHGILHDGDIVDVADIDIYADVYSLVTIRHGESGITAHSKSLKEAAASLLFDDYSDVDNVFSIASPRHFNNIRFAPVASNFKLVDDVNFFEMEHYSGLTDGFGGRSSDPNADSLFLPLYGDVFEPFGGMLDGTKAVSSESSVVDEVFAVSGIKVCDTSHTDVGIFYQIGEDGCISNVCFNGCYIEGASNVGVLSGTFAGTANNITISGAVVSGNESVGGLAGVMVETGAVNGVTVSSSEITGGSDGSCIGGLIGKVMQLSEDISLDDAGYIRNCCALKNISGTGLVDGKVSGSTYTGGIVGLLALNGLNIVDCSNDMDISGKYAGGIVGAVGLFAEDSEESTMQRNSIKNCSNGGKVSDLVTGVSGGIVGIFDKGIITISDCVNMGIIESSFPDDETLEIVGSGGIVGVLAGSIDADMVSEINNNVNSGDVTGISNVGGIIGYMQNGSLSSCTSGCVVFGEDCVGGIIGKSVGQSVELIEGEVPICFNTVLSCQFGYTIDSVVNEDGSVEKTQVIHDSVARGSQSVGGIIGCAENGMNIFLCATSPAVELDCSVSKVGGIAGAVSATYDGAVSTASQLYSVAVMGCENNASIVVSSTKAADLSGGIVGIAESVNLHVGTYPDADGNAVFTRNFGNVNGRYNVGGIIGGAGAYYDSLALSYSVLPYTCITIEQAKNISPVNGTAYIGGIVGFMWPSTSDSVSFANIDGCTSVSLLTNNVVVTSEEPVGGDSVVNAGGIVGYMHGERVVINKCNNDFSFIPDGIHEAIDFAPSIYISGDNVGGNVGGLVGGIYCQNGYSAQIVDSVNYVDVISTGDNVGGFIGFVNIQGDTSAPRQINGLNTVSGFNISGKENVGGIVGASYGAFFKDCSTTTCEINANAVCGGIVGKLVDGDMSICKSDASVSSTGFSSSLTYSGGHSYSATGGIAGVVSVTPGYSKTILFDDVSNLGNVASDFGGIGGIIGVVDKGEHLITVSKCDNRGSVSGRSNSCAVGGLVGLSLNKNFIVNNVSSNHGSVSGFAGVGGIIGSAGGVHSDYSTLNSMFYVNSYAANIEASNEGDILGQYCVGGIIGEGYASICCSNSSNISGAVSGGNAYVGGIAGAIFDGHTAVLEKCNTSGGIAGSSSNASHVGGIVGFCNGDVSVSECSVDGNISGDFALGGIIGSINMDVSFVEDVSNYSFSYYESNSNIKVEHCSYRGDSLIKGQGVVGGIIGVAGSKNTSVKVSNCTSSADITSLNVYSYAGGIMGMAYSGVVISDCVVGASGTSVDADVPSISAVGRYVGGVCGRVYSILADTLPVDITGCSSYADINCGYTTSDSSGGISSVGGIIGSATGYVKMTGCENYGNISADGACVGGIAGELSYGRDIAPSAIISVFNSVNYGSVVGDCGTKSRTGGVIGYVASLSFIDDCTNEGNVSSQGSMVGGVIGYYSPKTYGGVNSTLSQCKNIGSVECYCSDNAYAGGIIGYGKDIVNASDCENSGNIISYGDFTGGIAGVVEYSDLKMCINTGDVTGHGHLTGGIVGALHYASSLNACTSRGTILSDADQVGGIAGAAYFDVNSLGGSFEPTLISDCFFNGSVRSKYEGQQASVGGIVGFSGNPDDLESDAVNGVLITGCAIGDPDIANGSLAGVDGLAYVRGGKGYAGGIAGTAKNTTVENCYVHAVVSATEQVVGGIVGYADKVFFDDGSCRLADGSKVGIGDGENLTNASTDFGGYANNYLGWLVGCFLQSN